MSVRSQVTRSANVRGSAQATSRQIAHEVAKVATESRSRDAEADLKQEIENNIFFSLL